MSIVLRIQTQGDVVNTVRSLNRIKKKMPQMTRLGMRRWGNILEKDMKASARNARIGKFTGTLQGKGIRYEQGKRSDKGQLFIRLYGVYLDSMRPHFVNVTRRRTTLLTWAKRARSMSIRMKANEVSKGERRAFGIFVKPHPFIQAGYRRARPKLKPVLKRAAARGVAVA